MEQNNLTHNPFEDVEAHFTFGDAAAWGLALCLSTSKARYMGFTGYVDTLEVCLLITRSRLVQVPDLESTA